MDTLDFIRRVNDSETYNLIIDQVNLPGTRQGIRDWACQIAGENRFFYITSYISYYSKLTIGVLQRRGCGIQGVFH